MVELQFGKVRGQYLLVKGATSRAAAGRVTFNPIEPDEIVDGPKVTTREQTIAVFDGDGWLHLDEVPVQHVELAVGRWEADFRNATGLTVKKFQFDVTPTGDGYIDLPALAPITPGPAVKFVVNEAVYTQTLEARDEAIEAVASVQRGEPDGVASLDGDGVVPEAQLPDRLSASSIAETVGDTIGEAKGAAGGLASLDGNGDVPDAQLPTRLSPEGLLGTIGAAVSTVGSNSRALDAMVSALDMRDARSLVIASAGDSTTSPFSTGAFMRAWKELAAAVWPDRPFRVFAWGKDSNAYPASPTVWQDAAVISDPGGNTPNSIIAADSFALNTGDMANRAAEVGASTWSSTVGSYTAQDGACVANPAYSGGGIPGVTIAALTRVGSDFDYKGEWRISSQDTGSLQRRLRAAVNGTTGEIRVQATGTTSITVTVTKIIGGVTTTLGTFPAGTIPSSTATAWYPFRITLAGTTLTLVLNGQTLTYTLDTNDPASLGATFGMADNSRNAGIRAFEVRGTVTRPPVVGGPSPLGWATVYNAAVAGSTIAYQQARIAAMYPVQPDVIFIHHGHNYASGTTTPDQFFAAVDAFLAALFTTWAACPVVISSQNPEFPATDVDAARIARHLAIQRTIRSEATRRGWGYVPVFEAFAARADGGASYVQPDGIHPVIGNGTNLQTDTLKAAIKRSSLRP